MTRQSRIRFVLPLLGALCGCTAASPDGRVEAALGSPGMVISQVYGGGGLSGAVLSNKYVELFNRGAATVSLGGWSVQYGTAASNLSAVHALASVDVQPGQYYLLQLGAGTGATNPSPLPVTPDETDSINISSSAGKIVLANVATLLSCGAASSRCFGQSQVVDLVGYGNSAADYEGPSPAPGFSNNNHVDVRNGAGCVDTDDNPADFTRKTWAAGPSGVTLHDSSSAFTDCPVVDLAGVDLETVDLQTVDLQTVDLQTVDLQSVDLQTVDLESVDLEGVDLAESVDLAETPDLSTPPDLATVVSSLSPGEVLLSQLYPGGGLSSAHYTNKFVELFNPSATRTVDLTGASVQYATATGSFANKADLPSGATIAPGHYYLIQLASGGAVGAPLPAPDFAPSGAEAFNISATAGKVALVAKTSLLTCGTAGSRCSDPAVIDLLGYGSTASDYQGSSPAPAPSNNTQSLQRKGSGCVDDQDNFSDFTRATVAPRDGASAPVDCTLMTLPDLAAAIDLAVRDLSVPRDLSPPRDLSVPRDDLAVGAGDLATPATPDLAAPPLRHNSGACGCMVGRAPDGGALLPSLLLMMMILLAARRRYIRPGRRASRRGE